ncbi:MAG: 16S rRNA (cytidine(1402)-2'-O)-methyltransferase [Pseudomonadota bacterium]
MEQPGTLYVIATPLGNLEDLTFRAARILGEVRAAAAEDTRRTMKIMSHLGLRTKVISYREQNHQTAAPRIIAHLVQGEDIALVSDAGVPGVSDPGALLVAEAVNRGIRVVPIPGASAPPTALSVSGFSGDSYLFVGFTPTRQKARRRVLEEIREQRRTLVFFEAPHRLKEFLEDALAILGDRSCVVGREMTKLNEEFMRGTLAGLAAQVASSLDRVRGEITVVVSGAEDFTRRLTREELLEIIKDDDRPVREIVAELAGSSDLNRSELYRLVLEASGRR